MQLNDKQLRQLIKWGAGIVLICALVFLAARNVSLFTSVVSWFFGLFSSLILGFLLALVLNVPMAYFERVLFSSARSTKLKKLRRPLSMILALVLILSVFTAIVYLIIPELVQAIRIIIDSVTNIARKLGDMEHDTISEIYMPLVELLEQIDWNSAVSAIESWVAQQGQNILNTLLDIVKNLVGSIIDFVIALVFSMYILANKEKLKTQVCRLFRAWIPGRFTEWFIHAAGVCSNRFRNFISGQSLEAVILGSLCLAGMLILKLPYAPMISTLVGVTALVPVVGSFLGAGIGAFMILTVSPLKALIFLIFLLILQQIEGNIIYPRVMGTRVNLPSMWVLAAVTVGGGIAGPLGMLLGVPAAGAAYELLREATENREKKFAAAQSASPDDETDQTPKA